MMMMSFCGWFDTFIGGGSGDNVAAGHGGDNAHVAVVLVFSDDDGGDDHVVHVGMYSDIDDAGDHLVSYGAAFCFSCQRDRLKRSSKSRDDRVRPGAYVVAAGLFLRYQDADMGGWGVKVPSPLAPAVSQRKTSKDPSLRVGSGFGRRLSRPAGMCEGPRFPSTRLSKHAVSEISEALVPGSRSSGCITNAKPGKIQVSVLFNTVKNFTHY